MTKPLFRLTPTSEVERVMRDLAREQNARDALRRKPEPDNGPEAA